MAKRDKNPFDLETFRCRRCGHCCTGAGYVNIDMAECESIAKYLEMPMVRFLEHFTVEMTGYDRWLIDGEGDDQPCVFLLRDPSGLASCRIEAVKPRQCRDFPSKWQRDDAKDWCAGILAKDSAEFSAEGKAENSVEDKDS